MTETPDLSRIAVLVPGKLSDHAGSRIDKTFDMLRMESADPAKITPELAQKVRGIAAFSCATTVVCVAAVRPLSS